MQERKTRGKCRKWQNQKKCSTFIIFCKAWVEGERLLLLTGRFSPCFSQLVKSSKVLISFGIVLYRFLLQAYFLHYSSINIKKYGCQGPKAAPHAITYGKDVITDGRNPWIKTFSGRCSCTKVKCSLGPVKIQTDKQTNRGCSRGYKAILLPFLTHHSIMSPNYMCAIPMCGYQHTVL